MRKAMDTQYRLQYRHVNGLESWTQDLWFLEQKPAWELNFVNQIAILLCFVLHCLKRFYLYIGQYVLKKCYAVSTKLKFWFWNFYLLIKWKSLVFMTIYSLDTQEVYYTAAGG